MKNKKGNRLIKWWIGAVVSFGITLLFVQFDALSVRANTSGERHQHEYEAIIIEASCTEDGCIMHICGCGDSYVGEVLPALGHEYEAIITEATCTEDGYTTYVCICEYTYTGDVVEALGHEYEAVITEASCTEDGYTTYTCSCGDSYVGDKVTALGHDYEAVITEATCIEDGYTTYSCGCGDSYVGDEVKASGHEYEGIITEATCTEEGYTTYTCACGDSYVGDEIEALGHEYESAVTEATCTEDGYTTYICVCGDSYVGDEIEALGHEYESVVIEASCTEDGYTIYTCACGESYVGDEVKASGHDMSEWLPYENSQERSECNECDYFETREVEKITPEAPVIKGSNVSTSGKPNVSWEKVDGAVKYQVYRATSKTGTYSLLVTTTETAITNTSAVSGKSYYYKVRAISADGMESEFSNISNVVCNLATPVVKATNVSNTGKIKLTWNKVEGATKYEVYRATTKNGEYKKLYTTKSLSLVNTSAIAGKTYYYKVKAIHSTSAANSSYSVVISRTCDLAAPVVKATNVTSTGKIKLTWNKVEGATKYEIYRATAKNGEYKKLYTTKSLSLVNTSATAGKTYYYKVKAIHSSSAANSAYSTMISRTCDLACPVVKLTNVTSGKVKVSWNKVQGVKKYEIYRATSKNGTYKKIYTTSKLTFTNTSVTKGKTYYYKVKAIHGVSVANSAYSTIKSIKVK